MAAFVVAYCGWFRHRDDEMRPHNMVACGIGAALLAYVPLATEVFNEMIVSYPDYLSWSDDWPIVLGVRGAHAVISGTVGLVMSIGKKRFARSK